MTDLNNLTLVKGNVVGYARGVSTGRYVVFREGVDDFGDPVVWLKPLHTQCVRPREARPDELVKIADCKQQG